MSAGIDVVERNWLLRSVMSEIRPITMCDGTKVFEHDKSSDWTVWLPNGKLVNSLFDDLNEFLDHSYISQMYVFADEMENGRHVWHSARADSLTQDELASLLMEQDLLGREIVFVARNNNHHDGLYGCLFVAMSGRFGEGNSNISNTISDYLPKLCEVVEK